MATNFVANNATSDITTGRYFTFTVAPAANYVLGFTNLQGGVRASNTGPTNMQYVTVIAGSTTAIGSAVTMNGNDQLFSSALTNSGLTTAVEFRLVGWRTSGTSSSSTGTGRFGNAGNPTTTLTGSAVLRSATTLTWDGGRGNGDWNSYSGTASDQSNWNLNNIPASSLVDSLSFAGSSQNTTTNNISSLTVGSIAFASGASAFTNSGNSLTLNDGVTNSSSNLQTISHALVLASGSRGFDAASGDLSIAGAVSGAGGIVNKLGTNVLTLSASNSHTGGTTLTAGTLRAGNDSAFGSGTLNLKGGTISGTGSVARSISNAVVLGGNATFGDGAATGALRFSGAVDLGGATRSLTTVVSTTFSGTISNGSLTKLGSSTMSITSLQSFSGSTTISAGALALSGSGGLASSLITVASGGVLDVTGRTGGMTLASGQTLAGTGTVAGLMVVGTNATVAPGNSPGTLNVGSMEFAAGGNFNWQIYDLGGGAGTGWDFISGTGSLNVTAGTGGGAQFNINLWTLSGLPDVSGTLAGFNKNYDYRWKLAEFAGGITGFSPEEFLVQVAANNGAGGFANNITIDGVPGTFSVAQGGPSTFGTVDQLYIVYAAAPEPSTLALAGVGLAAAGWATRRRQPSRPNPALR